MSEAVKTYHYGIHFAGWIACGLQEYGSFTYEYGQDTANVTCKRCRKTKAFRIATGEIRREALKDD